MRRISSPTSFEVKKTKGRVSVNTQHIVVRLCAYKSLTSLSSAPHDPSSLVNLPSPVSLVCLLLPFLTSYYFLSIPPAPFIHHSSCPIKSSQLQGFKPVKSGRPGKSCRKRHLDLKIQGLHIFYIYCLKTGRVLKRAWPGQLTYECAGYLRTAGKRSIACRPLRPHSHAISSQ